MRKEGPIDVEKAVLDGGGEVTPKTPEQRIQSVTRKDVNNLYQNIMNDCQSDEGIQKIYKVLEYYRNNP